jgi:glucose/mannose-6-phosphate isomerase
VASLVALGDWTSTYLALAQGFDPTPVEAIDELKAGTGR